MVFIRTDSLLQGGLREGQVTELVGPSSSGKTQVCIPLLGITYMPTSCGLFLAATKNLEIRDCW